jgi:hypothetical protein
MLKQGPGWRDVLGASLLVGAVVFAATLVYLADRVGWVLGAILGLAPALVLGLAAAGGHFVLALTVSGEPARKARAKIEMDPALVRTGP